MSADARQDTGRTTDGSASTKRRRRAPTPQEQARRTAVIKAQAEIGYEWQRTRLGKEAK